MLTSTDSAVALAGGVGQVKPHWLGIELDQATTLPGLAQHPQQVKVSDRLAPPAQAADGNGTRNAGQRIRVGFLVHHGQHAAAQLAQRVGGMAALPYAARMRKEFAPDVEQVRIFIQGRSDSGKCRIDSG